MLYVIAFFVPPLAVFLTGRFWAFFLNILLTLFFVLPGIIHAFSVIGDYKRSKADARLIRRMNQAQ
jgi:uncharacterized membrane protein YqaE (UPF0057 family)